jgi:geranylgeranyl pyrophosphate synthase
VRFSQAETILAAVALTSRSTALLLSAPGIRAQTCVVMARLACDTVAGAMAVGQAIELGHDDGVSPERVRSIHERKTASLFGLAASLAVACGPGTAGLAEPLVRFATLLGRAYQIIDDIEDRLDPSHAGGNLARAVGKQEAALEAANLLRAARRTVADLPAADGLRACVDWFERRLDGA